jgi:hypothetical protein
MSVLPCLFCGDDLEQRKDKNQKPYFICNPCGMQLFVRRPKGAENLQNLIRTLHEREIPMRAHARNLFQISAILQELNGVERELKKLEDSIGFFSQPGDEKLRAIELLRTRMQTLLSDLERIAEGR